jgi:sarcosine oxidase subunit gamma
MVLATDFARRSPLHHAISAHGAATWQAVGEAAIVERVAGVRPPLGIVDLSPLPRLGFKGRETLATMQALGVQLEPTPNRAYPQADGSLCLVLGPGEVFLLGAPYGENALIGRLESGACIADDTRCYAMPRRDSHAWFAIMGAAASALFAKICAVDLRLERFPNLSIAQTSVAKLNAIVLRADIGGQPVFHLLSDSSAARSMLESLLDAAGEFGGGLAGRHFLPQARTLGEDQTDGNGREGQGESTKTHQGQGE